VVNLFKAGKPSLKKGKNLSKSPFAEGDLGGSTTTNNIYHSI
jgi:hypothetical protein